MPEPFPSPPQLSRIRRETLRFVRKLVAARSAGELNEASFVDALLTYEAEKIARLGLLLTASHTLDEWIVVNLKVPRADEPCLHLEFHPVTGAFRTPLSDKSKARRTLRQTPARVRSGASAISLKA